MGKNPTPIWDHRPTDRAWRGFDNPVGASERLAIPIAALPNCPPAAASYRPIAAAKKFPRAMHSGPAVYHFDPQRSRFTVTVTASGVLALLGYSPLILV